ncbi:halocyanin domain-containing protein [Haloarcula salinisoli]|uniref:Halocyanin domain-containing protein n=1 Tax=Haloarcula salinisoli TaxID=2487746 RepID=A0A8J7YFW5_9EURY|nr:halocyanin domain-containing protein [Halomicroarcula salinisoli]MBX0287256.1 halocyanin domain-containing protein [Halomicroarcula salinisoli]MBX0305180.1 halocyanin domain-containing protein [Halomicroarcula salinisoli]
MNATPDRRSFIRAIGAVTVAGAVAGCSGGGDSGNGDGTATGSGSDVPEAVSSYLSETTNFDGSLTDETDSDSVTIDVGAQGNNGAFGFGPAAVKISTGTTVTWEWTGEGSNHNVIAQEGASFESEQSMEEGFSFEQTFEETGVVTYYCGPHETLGMKGALVVE